MLSPKFGLTSNKKSTSLFGLTFAQSEFSTERKTNLKSEVSQCQSARSLHAQLTVVAYVRNVFSRAPQVAGAVCLVNTEWLMSSGCVVSGTWWLSYTSTTAGARVSWNVTSTEISCHIQRCRGSSTRVMWVKRTIVTLITVLNFELVICSLIPYALAHTLPMCCKALVLHLAVGSWDTHNTSRENIWNTCLLFFNSSWGTCPIEWANGMTTHFFSMHLPRNYRLYEVETWHASAVQFDALMMPMYYFMWKISSQCTKIDIKVCAPQNAPSERYHLITRQTCWWRVGSTQMG